MANERWEQYKGKPGTYEVEGGTLVVTADGNFEFTSNREAAEARDYPTREDPFAPLPSQTEETPAPVSAADDEESGGKGGNTRTNKNGIVQKGMTLGGLQEFQQFNPNLNIANGANFFNFGKTDRKDAYKGTDNTVSTGDVGWQMPEGSKPKTKKGTVTGTDLKIGTGNAGGWEIPTASVPGTLGHTGDDPQNGVSDSADQADQERAISMKPFRGSERQREFADRPGNRPPVSEASANKGKKTDKARQTYGRAFLDSTSKGPMGVLRDAAASIGVVRTNDGGISIRDGDNYRTYTGDKSAREVAYDLGGGQKGYDLHAGDFTTIGVPDSPKVKPDDEQTPATIEGSTETPWKEMTMDQKKGAVNAYAQDFVNTFRSKLKDKK